MYNDFQSTMHPIEGLSMPSVEEFELSNGLRLYAIGNTPQPVIKLEVVFMAGRPYEDHKLISTACAALLREGTFTMNSARLSESIDQFGASISCPFSFDAITIQLYTLRKHLTKVLPLLIDIIEQPTFPEEELALFKKRAKEKLALDLAQNEIRAYRSATELFFGPDHPYGYNSSIALFDEIAREHIVQHHQRLFTTANAFCMLAGNIDSKVIRTIDTYLSKWQRKERPPTVSPPTNYPKPKQLKLPGNRHQAAIRLGRPIFSRQHPDFAGLFVLNTVLGGYFGSRLMRNLRERKGYTYGIESSLETMRFGGYLSISLETEQKLVFHCLQEIQTEINLLQSQLVDLDELQMVKNYLAGYLLSLSDGPLAIAEVVRGNLVRSMPVDHALTLLDDIHKVTPTQLQELAHKYLSFEGFSQVVVF